MPREVKVDYKNPTRLGRMEFQKIGIKNIISAYVIYLLLSNLIFFPRSGASLDSFTHKILATKDNIWGWADATAYIFFFKWWCWSIWHHVNPFVCKYIWAPFGVNMAASPSSPALAFMFFPTTLICGPVASYNIAMLLMIQISGLSCFALCYKLNGDFISSLMGGCVYAFTSYTIAHFLGHLAMLCNFIYPLFAIVLLERLVNNNKRHFILYAVVLFVLQIGISLERTLFIPLFFIPFFFALTWVLKVKLNLVKDILVEIILAVVASLIVAGPYIYYFCKALRSDMKFLDFNPDNFGVDLYSMVIPNIQYLFFGNIFPKLSFIANRSEYSFYLGIPLCILIVVMISLILKRVINQNKNCKQTNLNKILISFLIAFLSVFILSLGGHLIVFGQDTGVVLPWHYLAKINILHFALPERLAFCSFLCLAVIFSIWISQSDSDPVTYWGKLSVLGLCLLFTAPNPNNYKFVDNGYASLVPDFFTNTDLVKRYIPKDSTVLIFPLEGSATQLDLVASSFYFKSVNAYVGTIQTVPWQYQSFPFEYLYTGKVTDFPRWRETLLTLLAISSASEIIIDSHTEPDIKQALDKLGWVSDQVSDVKIIRAPSLITR